MPANPTGPNGKIYRDTDSVKSADDIRAICVVMHAWLWSHGWNITLDRVIRHHRWFERWWDKQLSFGYVVNRVGITRRDGWD